MWTLLEIRVQPGHGAGLYQQPDPGRGGQLESPVQRKVAARRAPERAVGSEQRNHEHWETTAWIGPPERLRRGPHQRNVAQPDRDGDGSSHHPHRPDQAALPAVNGHERWIVPSTTESTEN